MSKLVGFVDVATMVQNKFQYFLGKSGADKSVKDCLGKIALDYVINNEWILVDSPLKDNRKEIAKILQNC